MASIKGVALQSVTEDVHRLRAEGRLPAATLAARLKDEDRTLLEEMTSPSLWYPIASYGRLLDLLCEIEGRGDEAYLVERGVRAAERMMQVGAYRHVLQSAGRWGDRAGEMMIQLASGFYDFTRWSLRYDERVERYLLEVEGAADFPDAARHTAQGFVQVLFARMGGRPVTVRSRRPAPDRFLYEIAEAQS
jgi:hypothetical protein